MVLLKFLIFWNKFSGHRRKFSWKPISTGGACFSWWNPSNLRPFYQGSSFALPPYQSRCKVGAKSVGKGRSIEFGTEEERRKGELSNAKTQRREDAEFNFSEYRSHRLKGLFRLRSWLASVRSRISVVERYKINATLTWYLWSLMFPRVVRHIISH